MSNLVVQPVATRGEQKTFLRLPWKLYASDPNWIPPLRANQKALVGYSKHPFYDDAEAQTFIALRDGEPVGRIAAIINHAHNRRYEEQRGFFGFFETIDDQQVVMQLFDAAREWLQDRGIRSLRGPVNPSLNYECGLLVEGFDTPPYFMMTYNPEFYGRLIQAYGFQKSQDLFAFFGHMDMMGGLDPKIRTILYGVRDRFNIFVRPIDRKNFRAEVATFLRIYNASLPGTWGFVPLSESEIDRMSDEMRHLISPELAMVAEVDGKPVGVVFCLLDYNPRIKAIDGKLFPFGFIRLLWNKRKIKNIRLISTNVVPEYQRWGVGLVLLAGLVPAGLEWGLEYCEFSWVLESNHLSRTSLEKGGAKRSKTYRIYDYEW
jgi:GNAT superfamily N-acetyltransferase